MGLHRLHQGNEDPYSSHLRGPQVSRTREVPGCGVLCSSVDSRVLSSWLTCPEQVARLEVTTGRWLGRVPPGPCSSLMTGSHCHRVRLCLPPGPSDPACRASHRLTPPKPQASATSSSFKFSCGEFCPSNEKGANTDSVFKTVRAIKTQCQRVCHTEALSVRPIWGCCLGSPPWAQGTAVTMQATALGTGRKTMTSTVPV